MGFLANLFGGGAFSLPTAAVGAGPALEQSLGSPAGILGLAGTSARSFSQGMQPGGNAMGDPTNTNILRGIFSRPAPASPSGYRPIIDSILRNPNF